MRSARRAITTNPINNKNPDIDALLIIRIPSEDLRAVKDLHTIDHLELLTLGSSRAYSRSTMRLASTTLIESISTTP